MSFQQIALPASRVVLDLERQIKARKQWPLERANNAAAWVRLSGGTAMEAATAAIAAGFDEACMVNSFKLSVLHILNIAEKFGATHPLIRARYEARAGMIRAQLERWHNIVPLPPEDQLSMAQHVIMRQWRAETNRFQKQVLREMRLLLKIIGKSEYRAHFLGILDLVCGLERLQAAE